MEKETVIENPVSHASGKYNKLFVQDDYLDLWGEDASYCTTGQFAGLGRGFVKHCGPTAVTNVLITFMNRAFAEGRSAEKPDNGMKSDIFLKVSEIGSRKGIYWNTDFMKMFGGTFDTFTKVLLRSGLREFGLSDIQAMRRRRATEKNFKKCLEAGCICYLQLRFDKPYGSHHVVCYGYSYVKCEESGKRYMYLKIADGWSTTPRYMEASDMMLNMFIPVKTVSKIA